MSDAILQDAEEHPDFFDFKFPVTRQEIHGLEHALDIKLPPSFVEVLTSIGQGSFFDNETLLGVHETDDGTGDIQSVNHELRTKQGLASTLLVFHLGTGGMHAFDTSGPGPEYEVVALDEDTLKRGELYNGFDNWYEEAIRNEYASMLGLD